MVQIERDHKITAMSSEVYGKIEDIINAIDPKPVIQKNTFGLKDISLEDAMRELLELEGKVS